MKNLLRIFFLVLMAIPLNAQKTLEQTKSKTLSLESQPYAIDLNFVMYDASLFFPAFDIELGIPFWKKGGNSFAYLNTLFFYIPSSPNFPSPPYMGFGWIPQLQYRFTIKGFWTTLETGLGVFSEFKNNKVFKDGVFRRDTGTPYGLFSVTGRLGYEFGHKYKVPISLAFVLGYRLQFPYNLTLNHIILVGVSLGYSFPIDKEKK